jgi:hypothetical protein
MVVPVIQIAPFFCIKVLQGHGIERTETEFVSEGKHSLFKIRQMIEDQTAFTAASENDAESNAALKHGDAGRQGAGSLGMKCIGHKNNLPEPDEMWGSVSGSL